MADEFAAGTDPERGDPEEEPRLRESGVIEFAVPYGTELGES